MFVGLELALALAPLVIIATEYHLKAYDQAKTILSSRARDEKLEDFLTELHDEVAILAFTLRYLISDLTTLNEPQREQLLKLDRVQWKQDDISDALRMRLGSVAEITFRDILGRLLKSLDEVVSERSLNFISSERVCSSAFFKKLEVFREEMKNGRTVQDLGTRFQFTTKEARRSKHLKRIRRCNKKLEFFVFGCISSPSDGKKATTIRKTPLPTNLTRRLSQDVHKRISRCWNCPCPSLHEAKLSLFKCLMNHDSTDTVINLDLIVSMMTEEQPTEIWLGSRIRILSDKNRKEGNAKAVVRFMDESYPAESIPAPKDPHRFIGTESVCTLIKEAHKKGSGLELVFDGENLWRARSTGKHVMLRPEIGIPLNTLLLGNSQARLRLKDSRVLAVVLAHAVLHYCESPWVSNSWNKQHVSFYTTVDGINLRKPYLATQFDEDTVQLEVTEDDLYSHPSPTLLALGILLLELYLKKPIESFWDPDDTEDGLEGVNTNWVTAEKQLEKQEDDVYEGYRNAIKACLQVEYVNRGGPLSLDDEDFRNFVYEQVVVPLENELKNGFNLTPEELGVL
ncbi:uncharacterized protein RAG0_14883 [Rhynchosporium agropyri]|uniref:DUF7580 domain-containing protein n=1 Tax=Rhynchosporium agropyri TaxID=914238 RepID=A0A1E1LIN7_9HELO|nr:uncharacterized protein RAG0_14883 [Rhynchosporium agropyri]